MKLTGAQILWECARARRGDRRVRLPGRRDPAGLRRDARAIRSATCSSATSRARRTWPTATRARADGRRRDRDLGPRRDQHGHRHRDGDDGLVADCLHHRSGRQQADRLRRVPGDRHHRHHAADHQAQLPGHERRRRRAGDPRGVRGRASPAVPVRCSSTSPRTRSRERRGRLGRAPSRTSPRRTTMRCRATATHRDALALINAAERPLILAGHGVMLSGAEREILALAERAQIPIAVTLLGIGGVAGVASAEPRHDGHARRGVGQQRDSGSRSADRARHAVRRPRHRQPQDLRAQRARRSTSTSIAPS